jgi:intermediate cleaving peptidase 55
MTLYCAGKDPAKEKWEGSRTSLDDAVTLFGADDARPFDQLPTDLRAVLRDASPVYIDVPSTRRERAGKTSAKSLLKYLTGLGGQRREHDSVLEGLAAARKLPLAPLVGRLRSVKSKHEQAVMRAAADVSGVAHAKVCFKSSSEWVMFVECTLDNALCPARNVRGTFVFAF